VWPVVIPQLIEMVHIGMVGTRLNGHLQPRATIQHLHTLYSIPCYTDNMWAGAIVGGTRHSTQDTSTTRHFGTSLYWNVWTADDCQLTSNVRTHRLWSMDTAMCVILRSNNTFGDRCFASAGRRLWNTLPAHLCQCDSLGQFRRLLKTQLFGSWDRSALCHYC